MVISSHIPKTLRQTWSRVEGIASILLSVAGTEDSAIHDVSGFKQDLGSPHLAICKSSGIDHSTSATATSRRNAKPSNEDWSRRASRTPWGVDRLVLDGRSVYHTLSLPTRKVAVARTKPGLCSTSEPRIFASQTAAAARHYPKRQPWTNLNCKCNQAYPWMTAYSSSRQVFARSPVTT
jgi:hypothetical protein